MQTIIVPIILGLLGSGGLISGFAAFRSTKVHGRVEEENATLAQMSKLNEQLNVDNQLMRAEIRTLKEDVVKLTKRVVELEHDLREARK